MPQAGITIGIEALRRDNPWPEFAYGSIAPFYLSLDGGGRHIITELIQALEPEIMVEIGCFLCGSTKQWLDADPAMAMIGIDPWDGNWSPYLTRRAASPSMATLDNIDRVKLELEIHGNFCVALNNIRAYKDRFIPIRQRSPAALEYLKKRSIVPQIIYIDAFKERADLDAAHALFPHATICGDDWNWRSPEGVLQMQKNVKDFAAEQSFAITADKATWLLTPKEA